MKHGKINLPIKILVAKSPQGGEIIQLPEEKIFFFHDLQWDDTWDLFDYDHKQVEYRTDPHGDIGGKVSDRFNHHPDDGLDNNGW